MEVFSFKPLAYTRLPPQGDWPKPRSGHRVVCDETSLYLYGGFCPRLSPQHATEMDADPAWAESRPLFRELWRFDMSSRSWQRLPCEGTLPRELASSAACLRAGLLIVMGGSGFPFGSACSNRVYVYDASGGRGTTGMRELATTGDRPRPMYGQAVVLVGPYLYAIGGTTGFEFSCDVHRLDLRTARWEEMYVCTGARTEEPSGRYRHELAWDGRRIYVLGGGTGDRAFSLEKIHAFSISERHWEVLQTYEDPQWGFPSGRRYHGFVQLGGHAFIAGGFDQGEIMGDVWRLELATLRWTVLYCPLPQSVYFHSMAVTPSGCLYCFGGVKALHGDCTRTAEMCSVWLCVPSLEAMCCEAVRHYARRSPLFSREHLTRCGLPRNILSMIFS